MVDEYIKIIGVPHRLTQAEIDLVKAYEPPKETLYLNVISGEWFFNENGQYLVLTGSMLDAAKNNIIFRYNANKENN